MNTKRMKRLAHTAPATALVVLLCAIATACGNGSGDVMKLVEERDSLKAKSEQAAEKLSAINAMVSTLNSALDSIQVEEGMLFVSGDSETQMSRADAMQSLERYEAVLRHQRQRIAQLEAEMGDSAAPDKNLQGLVAHMKEQLAAKDAQISQLKKELQNKDVNISQLRRYVETQRTQIKNQTATIAELDRQNKSKTEALVRQDNVINNCYVLVGSKKDLKRKGIVKKGRIVSEAMMDKSKFGKVDIRKYREVVFEAKRPRILTAMPQSSYVLTTNGNGSFTLNIKNATEFWSISNFLVIQTD